MTPSHHWQGGIHLNYRHKAKTIMLNKAENKKINTDELFKLIQYRYQVPTVKELNIPGNLSKSRLIDAQEELNSLPNCENTDCQCNKLTFLMVSPENIKSTLDLFPEFNWGYIGSDFNLSSNEWYYGKFHQGIIYSGGIN